ncbi:MAG: hypothetical protein IKN02_05495 [Prevotella sp.]|jgi:hypothetical protein|nr:hypothetical protein [Prevotella sp.]
MKKLKFYLMLLVMLMATSVKAENVQYLVLNSGGEETVIALADNPVMTVNGGILKVTVAGVEKVSVDLSQGLTYRFSAAAPTAIQEVQNNESSRLEQGHIYIAHAREGETVRVFTAGGHLVATQRIGENGTADIDLTGLGKGLLIVKTANTSIKIMNK